MPMLNSFFFLSTKFVRMMYIIKDITVGNCTQSTWKVVWKNTQSPVEMFVKLLKLMIPLAYVNVTMIFL